MSTDPILRVRRRVIAEIIRGGGLVEPWQWLHAGLEPNGKHIAPPAAPLGRSGRAGPPSDRGGCAFAPRGTARKDGRHPPF